MDGDGLPEGVIGAVNADGTRGRAGAAYVVAGALLGVHVVTKARTTIYGETAGGRAGIAVLGLRDADGDGLGELAIGAPGAGPTLGGGVYLFHGPPAGTFDVTDADVRWYGDVGEDLGATLAGADLDGDTLADLIIGGRGYGGDVGRVWVIPGAGR